MAKKALLEFKQNPKSIHFYGPFLIATEVVESDQPQQHLQTALKQWDKEMGALQQVLEETPASSGDRVRAVMWYLMENQVKNYRRGSARLTDYLSPKEKEKGGNCEDFTKLPIAALTELGIRLPPSHTLAIQVFDDHLQPVIYDKKTGGVWNLIENRWASIATIKTPLYDPHLIYHAYLRSEGIMPPIAEERLLLAKPNGADKTIWDQMPVVGIIPRLVRRFNNGGFHSTNSNLLFPKPGAVFADGPVPERTQIPNPYLTPVKRSNIDESVGVPMEEFPPDEGRASVGKWGRERANQIGFFSLVSPGRVYFEKTADAHHFNRLRTLEEKSRYLLTVAARKLAARFQDPEAQRLLTLLSQPSEARRLEASEIKSASAWLSETDVFIVYASDYIAQLYLSPKDPITMGNPLFQKSFHRLSSQIPVLNQYQNLRKKFQERMRQYPLEFVLFTDRLSPEQRLSFINFIHSAGYPLPGSWVYVAPSITEEKIAAIIGDPTRIQIKKREKAGMKPHHQLVDVIEIGLVDWDISDEPILDRTPKEILPQRYSEGNPGKENILAKHGGKGNATEPSNNKTNKAHHVSPETLILFALRYYDQGKVPERWSPVLSRHFQKMNVDGAYDNLFKEAYPSLLQHYAKDSRWVSDPYLIHQKSQRTVGVYVEKIGYPHVNKSGLIPPDFLPILSAITERQRARVEVAQKI